MPSLKSLNLKACLHLNAAKYSLFKVWNGKNYKVCTPCWNNACITDSSIFEFSSIVETRGAICSWANFLTVGEKKNNTDNVFILFNRFYCFQKNVLNSWEKNCIHKLRCTHPPGTSRNFTPGTQLVTRGVRRWKWAVYSPVFLIIISSSVNICRGAQDGPWSVTPSRAADWEDFRTRGGVFQEDRQVGTCLLSCRNGPPMEQGTHTHKVKKSIWTSVSSGMTL